MSFRTQALAAFKAARNVMPQMTVQLTASGVTVKGTSFTVERDAYTVSLSGIQYNLVGGVRLVCDEIGPRQPEQGDKIGVKDRNGDMQTYRISNTREDDYAGTEEGPATVLVMFGIEQS